MSLFEQLATLNRPKENTLYFLGIGNAVYWSTSVAEINAFAKSFNMLGAVEEGKQVAFEIPGVICIHQFS